MEDETVKHAKEYFNTKMILQKKKKKGPGRNRDKEIICIYWYLEKRKFSKE